MSEREEVQAVTCERCAELEAEVERLNKGREYWADRCSREMRASRAEIHRITTECDASRADAVRLKDEVRSWIAENSPGGWIDDLRREAERLRAGEAGVADRAFKLLERAHVELMTEKQSEVERLRSLMSRLAHYIGHSTEAECGYGRCSFAEMRDDLRLLRDEVEP